MATSDDDARARNRAYNKKWRAKNKDRLATAKKIWAAKNADHIRAYNLAYSKTPERIEYQRNFRAMERANDPVAVRDRQRAFYRARRDRDPEATAKIYFRRSVRKYGLTPETYDDIFRAQDFKCAICKTPDAPDKRAWQIDHCHKTMKVRGILCRNCNLMLGMALDNPDTLLSAAGYVERNATQHRE